MFNSCYWDISIHYIISFMFENSTYAKCLPLFILTTLLQPSCRFMLLLVACWLIRLKFFTLKWSWVYQWSFIHNIHFNLKVTTRNQPLIDLENKSNIVCVLLYKSYDFHMISQTATICSSIEWCSTLLESYCV